MKTFNFLRTLFGEGKTEKSQDYSDELNSISQRLQSISDEFKTINSRLQNQQQEGEAKAQKQFIVTTLVNGLIAFIAIGGLIFSIMSFQRTLSDQQQIQTYTYWQNFLATTVQYSDLANGMDCIDSVSIEDLVKLSNSDNYGTTGADTARHKKFIQYAWFVGSALNASEIVYKLEKGDSAWENTLKDVLQGHTSYFDSEDFNPMGYDKDFLTLLDSAKQMHYRIHPKNSCR